MRYRLLLALVTACRLDAQSVPTSANGLPQYDLTVTLDFRAPRLQVDAQVRLPATDQPRGSISFALSELFTDAKVELRAGTERLDSVSIEKTNRPYSRAGWGTNTWRLVPSRPIPAGQPVILRVSYAGAGDLKSFVFSLGDTVAFGAGQTAAWYPEIEEAEPHPAGRLRGLRGTGTLSFLVDSDVVVYTAARALAGRNQGGRKVLRYRVATPMYFSFAAGRYIATNATYYLKARPSARSDGTRATQVLRSLEREFGPHPFERFAVVEVPAGDAERAGFSGASADGFIMASSDFLDQPFNTAYYGHEIAHQWWGVTVRPTGSRGIWMLTEALAQFGSLRAVEAIEGLAAAERYRRDEYPGYLGQGGRLYFSIAAAGHDAALADLPLDSEWARPLADSKGFMAWNALSLEIGREGFRRILSGIASRYSTGRITWDQFLAEVTRGARRDLSWFYSQWFDRPGVPDWRVATLDSAGASRAVVMQDSLPYQVSVRVDIASERCPRATTRIVLRAEPTVLPQPRAKCGRPSFVIDPTYEIIHWTPELRRSSMMGVATSDGTAPKVYEIRNGSWFSGTGFERRAMYVSAGRFIAAPAGAVDSVVDVAGGFVVPPLAEGHNHWLEPAALAAYVQSYLRDGVFYVKDQANSPYVRGQFDSALNRVNSVDLISANQGWTGPGGHPLQIARQFVELGVFPRAWADSGLDPNVVMMVRDSTDIAARWPGFLAGKPDFVKVFLLNSEEYERRRNDEAYLYRRGMDPGLVPEIVRRAHGAGLRVSAHIYTAADFRNAVRGGVDDIAHFPGTGLGTASALPLGAYVISEADAAEAGRRGVTVTTTLSWLAETGDSVRRSSILSEVIRPNLARLRAHHVRLLIGSDQFRQTPASEADILVQSGLFTPLEALRAWSIDTPNALFPNRRLGGFSDGAEASFLVLAGDPLADFANVHRIQLRMKQGRILRLQDPAPEFPRLP